MEVLNAGGCGSSLYGIHNMLIAGAAAKIAVDSVPDFLFGGYRVVVKQLFAGHHHAGRAESALQSMLIPKGFLNWMEVAVCCKAFDGCDLRPVCLDSEKTARLDG